MSICQIENCQIRCKVTLDRTEFERLKGGSEKEFIDEIDFYAIRRFMDMCLTGKFSQYLREDRKPVEQRERITALWDDGVKSPGHYRIYCPFAAPDPEEEIVKTWKGLNILSQE